MPQTQLILVIGATGAQGIAVINALITPNAEKEAYSVRAFTRDVNSRRAKEFAALEGVEVAQGNMHDLTSIDAAMKGCYGVFVNIDGFTCGEQAEIYLGMRIFELAKMNNIKHWVWSSLDYGFKKGGYNPKYRCEHYDAKGRVAEWLQAQKSDPSGMIWSALATGPYMDMLLSAMFSPINKRKDGTYVFAAPIGSGHVPMIALTDLGYFARYIFDHPKETSAIDLEVASEMVSWPNLVSTFTKVTGKPAVFLPQTLDEHFALRRGVDNPVAIEFRNTPDAHKKTSWRSNFSGWWSLFADDVLKRDMEMLRRIHPNGMTLETWFREVGYDGDSLNPLLLKDVEDGSATGNPTGGINRALASKL